MGRVDRPAVVALLVLVACVLLAAFLPSCASDLTIPPQMDASATLDLSAPDLAPVAFPDLAVQPPDFAQRPCDMDPACGGPDGTGQVDGFQAGDGAINPDFRTVDLSPWWCEGRPTCCDAGPEMCP